MGNQVDFNKLRKRRQRTQSVKRLLALGIILAAVGGIVALNNFFIKSGVTTRLSDAVESFGGSGYPVPVPGGIIRDVKNVGKDLAVLNDTNLYIFNKNGKMITSLQQMGDQTVLHVNSDRVFTYDVGSKKYRIYSRSKTLLEKEHGFSLLGADMNGRGDFALISSTAQYAGQVVVYDSQFSAIYEWLSSDLVADVSINPKGNRMAAISLATRGGEIYSVVYVFDFNEPKELKRLELQDEMALGVAYLGDGRFSVLTDRAYRLYSGEGVEESSYSLGGRQVLAVERNGKEALLLLQESAGNRVQELVLLDSACGEQAVLELGYLAKDIAFGDRNIYTLADTGVTTYGKSLEPKGSLEMRGISGIHAIGSKLYYLGREEINVL